jgi:hypothetical protein
MKKIIFVIFLFVSICNSQEIKIVRGYDFNGLEFHTVYYLNIYNCTDGNIQFITGDLCHKYNIIIRPYETLKHLYGLDEEYFFILREGKLFKLRFDMREEISLYPIFKFGKVNLVDSVEYPKKNWNEITK